MCRYDRNFAPNVALSVEPFESVRKQRAAESLASLTGGDSAELCLDQVECGGTDDDLGGPAAKRRRRAAVSSLSPNNGHPRRGPITEDVIHDHRDDDDDDDDSDNESVSSDKRE